MNDTVSSRPWIAAYPPGTPATIDTAGDTNLLALLARTTGHRGDAVAFIGEGTTLSFGELWRRASSLAAWLGREAGLQPGDRVAVMLPNLTAFPVCLLGILQAGGVQVSVNPMYTPRELHHQLADSGARVLVAFQGVLPTVDAALAGTAIERVLVVGSAPAREGAAVPELALADALARGAGMADWQPPRLQAHDLALLQYTGGTTGVSKGAELTHGNLVANVLQVRAMVDGLIEDGAETIVTALPLYHIFALTVNCLTFMSYGARNVLVANPREPAQLVEAFTAHPVSLITGVNTLFAGLLALPPLKDVDFSRIKLAIGGGAAVQRAVSQGWYARSGRHILEGYGLSETSPVVTLNSWTNPEFSGAIGVPLPSTEVVIADEAGNPLPEGTEGEVCVKGPQVMRGYWRQAKATAAAFTPAGYFRTGDIGTMDARGFVKICDRKKDMILVSGFNVYPNEVEDVIAGVPGVTECAVAGVPDEKTGEAVKAFVVARDASLDEATLLAHCRAQLAAYKVPRHVEFVQALPKSSVGKILRRQLRQEAPSS